MFRLEPGSTGFRNVRDPDLPSVPVRTWRAACYTVAHATGGTVEHATQSTYPDNFHTAVITVAGTRHPAVCHLIHPWIAFTNELAAPAAPTRFLSPPPWSTAFTVSEFTILDPDVLDAPLSEIDTTALTKADWQQIRAWQPATTGEAIFNSWD